MGHSHNHGHDDLEGGNHSHSGSGGGGGGGHSHGHGGSCNKNHGPSLPGQPLEYSSMGIYAVGSNILFWLLPLKLSWSTTVISYILMQMSIFAALLQIRKIVDKKIMLSSAINFVGINTAVFIVSLLFIQFDGPEPGFPGKLVHIDCRSSSPKIEYLQQVMPFLKTAGATGILLDISTDDKALSSVVNHIINNGLDLVPYVQNIEDYQFWEDHESHILRIYADIKDSAVLNQIITKKSSKIHWVMVKDGPTGMDMAKSSSATVDVQVVVDGTQKHPSSGFDYKQWKSWGSLPRNSVWVTSLTDNNGGMIDILNQAQETSKWVDVAEERRVQFGGIILWQRPENLIPLQLPTVYLQLANIQQRKPYKYIKSKTFPKIGLKNINLNDYEKMAQDVAESSGNFPGADAFALAGKTKALGWTQSDKDKLKTALLKYYETLPTNFGV